MRHLAVDERYELVKPMGNGAYGQVCSARDNVSGEMVAIKKVSKAFEDLTDAKRTLREIKILSSLNHENVVRLRGVMKPESRELYEDIYLVEDLMETDLDWIIRSQQPLTDDHVQWFVYQILRAVKYIHSACVLHRDLKPKNILVNRNCEIKICDFGLARVTDPEDNGPDMTHYVVTRWYRAPELILRGEYSKAIDMWSVGCILAELLARRPLFPGKDYLQQIDLITKILGTPSDAELQSMKADQKAITYVKTLPHRQRQSCSALFPQASPLAIDLLEKLLCFDPTRRCSAEDALAHPYLVDYHDERLEPVSPRLLNFDFEDRDLSEHDLKDLIFDEIMRISAMQEQRSDQQMEDVDENSQTTAPAAASNHTPAHPTASFSATPATAAHPTPAQGLPPSLHSTPAHTTPQGPPPSLPSTSAHATPASVPQPESVFRSPATNLGTLFDAAV